MPFFLYLLICYLYSGRKGTTIFFNTKTFFDFLVRMCDFLAVVLTEKIFCFHHIQKNTPIY
ncbi:hypothetical protein HMPREF9074_08164 [Capnocytophaga sp. oral taxon 329 str. F0087]|nr:hypothetical protein HMPREF9074_08164 [Capnocytophaga sp. oral taxon 329 str. F0087]